MKHIKLVKIFLFLICLAIIAGLLLLCLNSYVRNHTKEMIITSSQAADILDADCIIVLGCKVKADGRPSDMLHDRLQRGIELYYLGTAPKLLMSGDHGQTNYDEVNTMKQFAIDSGIPSEDIFMDHAGFSTYETMYRARDVFCAKKVLIVTQEYHLYRALYIAEKLGLDAYGVPADYHIYAGQSAREVREILARCKDATKTIFMPKPTYLGEQIPITGNGDLTND